jgi:hypothetical protein
LQHGTTTNADGQAFEMPGWSDRSVHRRCHADDPGVEPSHAFHLEYPRRGLVEPRKTWFLTAASNDIKQVLEVCRWVRPLLNGGR